ncbi:hypothetical protein QVD17_28699 [Tagetes erecta]|uniref:Zinc knuckle CX2CX4HX4C n=1 Tax=Tagetes erecta TaxID=13708 RepID=A0AAD8KAW3_TARER|nr:hypothetical protein QVD17_28699 [Tagetes erecta]
MLILDGVERDAAEVGVDGSHAEVDNGVSHANPNIYPSTIAEPVSSVGVGSYAAKLTEGMKNHVNFRNSYARAMVDIDAIQDFKDNLSIAIPTGEEDGYVKEVMKVEYEWKPPRCATCEVFGHTDVNCPKKPKQVSNVPSKTDSEGFQEVKRKDKASYKHGFHVGKQKQKVEYRPVNRVESVPKSMKGSQDKMEGSLAKPNTGEGVVMSNSFSCLQTSEVGETSKMSKGEVEDDSDIEEVYNETELFMKDKVGVSANLSEGASTPGSMVYNV